MRLINRYSCLTLTLLALQYLQPASAIAAPSKNQSANVVQVEVLSPEDKYAAYIKNLMKGKGYPAYQKYILDFMQRGDYRALDAYLTSLQSAYEAGKLDDIELRYATEPLNQQTDPRYEQFYEVWIANMPKSYMARIARAAFHYQIAWAIRGEGYSNSVSAQQYEGFYRELHLALQDYKDSMLLTSKPILSYFGQISITGEAHALNPEQSLSSLMDEANQIDPQNYWARQAVMRFLHPRWGGSQAEMGQFVEYARQQGLGPAKLNLLYSKILIDQAEAAEYGDKNFKLAAEIYNEAIKLQMPYRFIKEGKDGLRGHIRAKEAMVTANIYDDEILSSLNILMDKSGNLEDGARYYGLRGHIYISKAVQTGNKSFFRSAWDDFQKGSELGDAFSMFKVASTYCEGFPGLVERNEDTCRELMQIAAEKGSAEAQGVMKNRWRTMVKEVRHETKPQQLTQAAQAIPKEILPPPPPETDGLMMFMSTLGQVFFAFLNM